MIEPPIAVAASTRRLQTTPFGLELCLPRSPHLGLPWLLGPREPSAPPAQNGMLPALHWRQPSHSMPGRARSRHDEAALLKPESFSGVSLSFSTWKLGRPQAHPKQHLQQIHASTLHLAMLSSCFPRIAERIARACPCQPLSPGRRLSVSENWQSKPLTQAQLSVERCLLQLHRM